jgi:hypothetical protein
MLSIYHIIPGFSSLLNQQFVDFFLQFNHFQFAIDGDEQFEGNFVSSAPRFVCLYDILSVAEG